MSEERPENIQKIVDQEDLPALLALVDPAIQSGKKSERETLSEAISEVLNIWLYDLYCGKGGNPESWGYLSALDALSKLNQRPYLSDRGQFLSLCMEYAMEHGDSALAQKHFNEAERLLKKAVESQDEKVSGYGHLISLYQNCPTSGPEDREARYLEALRLVNEAIALHDSFYPKKLWLIYQKSAPPSLNPVFEKEGDALFSVCFEKAKSDSRFAYAFANDILQLNGIEDQKKQRRIMTELARFTELAASFQDFSTGHDRVSAGHFFSKAGSLLSREDLIQVAEEHFKKALTLPQAFPLIRVYLMNAMKARGELRAKAGDVSAARALMDEIQKDYLTHAQECSHDISYLSHAMEFLIDSHFNLQTQKRQLPKELATQIYAMALAAEKQGSGHYWFPYSFLFWSLLSLGREEEAKLWLGRGYRLLNLLVEGDLRKLFEEVKKSASPDVAAFVEKLVYHFDHKVEKDVWRGGPPVDEVSRMTLADIHAWLDA